MNGLLPKIPHYITLYVHIVQFGTSRFWYQDQFGTKLYIVPVK